MDELTAFLDDVVPRLRAEVTALQNGDPGPRKSLWSRHDPVTLFGAESSAVGWTEVEPVFDRLADSFTGGRDCSYAVLAAGVGVDLGYLVAIERSAAGTQGTPTREFLLRVTTIFRRERGGWRIVHRHGDPFDAGSKAALDDRRQQGAIRPDGGNTDASSTSP